MILTGLTEKLKGLLDGTETSVRLPTKTETGMFFTSIFQGNNEKLVIVPLREGGWGLKTDLGETKIVRLAIRGDVKWDHGAVEEYLALSRGIEKLGMDLEVCFKGVNALKTYMYYYSHKSDS